MAMTLRVVVPPHPLIGHWLSVLRDRGTPGPLYATATAELGRWLTYEGIRQWLPHRSVQLQTGLDTCEGQVVDSGVPILACVLGTSGLGLWDGARTVLPNVRVLHLDAEDPQLPIDLDNRCGVVIFAAEIASGRRLHRLLERLATSNLRGERIRVIAALASAPGLQYLGETFPELTIHTACIDARLNETGRISPGIGCVAERLFGGASLGSVANPA